MCEWLGNISTLSLHCILHLFVKGLKLDHECFIIVYVYTARSGQRETSRLVLEVGGGGEFHFVGSHALKVGQSCLES